MTSVAGEAREALLGRRTAWRECTVLGIIRVKKLYPIAVIVRNG